MGLFGKKPPCPICGGKISWFLPAKVGGEYICSDCAKKIDMDDEIRDALTMESFREYLDFYEENRQLRKTFTVTDVVDNAGTFLFDVPKRLFCLSNDDSKLVFEGSALKGFRIREDNAVIMEGSDKGLMYYESRIPNQVMSMEPQIQMMIQTQRMNEQMARMQAQQNNTNNGTTTTTSSTYVAPLDIPEPIHNFYVDVRMEHPYRRTHSFSITAPRFDSNFPSTGAYLTEYQRDIAAFERLANILQYMAFPETGTDANLQGAASTAAAPQAAPEGSTESINAIEDIKKFKELLDNGLITQEEFDAKKKQLLGI